MMPPLLDLRVNTNSMNDLANSEQRDLIVALLKIASAVNQSLNINEVLNLILENIVFFVPYDAINVMLVDEGEMATMVACRGYETRGGNDKVLGLRRKVSTMPNLQRMMDSGKPIVVPDTQASVEWVPLSTSSWIRSYVSAPIVHNHKTLGFLNLNSSVANQYSSLHADRLLAFADQAAIAIQNARLFAKAQREISERKRFEEALRKANDELERRVKERTQEVSLANENLLKELARRRQAEADLDAERMLLARRVEERTKELSSANAELAKAAKMKDSFLASMSHELRTPLNAILNISESLMEQLYGPLNEAQLRLVRTAEESGRHLLSLINDILDLSKIDAGKLDLMCDFVPVKSLCDSSLRMIEEAARKKSIILSADYDPAVKMVWADPRRMKQILVNLLSNAVKFTPVGGSVSLIVAGDTEKKQVHFHVCDTGIGIEAENIPHLFKPFVQLDNALSRQYEGTGLGLALVYHITELHGGGVSVESEAGLGSRFTVTLNWDKKFGPTTAQLLAPEPEVDWRQVNEEAKLAPPVLLGQYLKELGIEIEQRWLDPANVQQDLNAADLVVIHAEIATLKKIIFGSGGGSKPILALPKGRVEADDVIAFDQAKVAYLVHPFNRSDLRLALRFISASGTASLFHKALFLDEKDLHARESFPQILIADDNEASARILNDYLEADGYRAVIAHDGAEAVQKARESHPNLILMDIQMPGMDGFEAIRRIRADEALKDIPILVLTALAMPGDRERSLTVGANGYISKPVVLRNLLEMIRAHVAQPK